jgi:hypothetical protein
MKVGIDNNISDKSRGHTTISLDMTQVAILVRSGFPTMKVIEITSAS